MKRSSRNPHERAGLCFDCLVTAQKRKGTFQNVERLFLLVVDVRRGTAFRWNQPLENRYACALAIGLEGYKVTQNPKSLPFAGWYTDDALISRLHLDASPFCVLHDCCKVASGAEWFYAVLSFSSRSSSSRSTSSFLLNMRSRPSTRGHCSAGRS